MPSRSQPSLDGYPGHFGGTDYHKDGASPRPLPRIRVSPDSSPFTSRRSDLSHDQARGINTDSDGVVRDDHNAQKDIPCCSYRVKTSTRYVRYDYMDELPYRAAYMGLVRNTTAHGLPHIHWATGFIKKTFWILLTLGLTAAWIWNSYEVLTSYLRYDVTISYDIRLAHEVEFPSVTICNQNVARSWFLERDPEARAILQRGNDELHNHNHNDGDGSDDGDNPPPDGSGGDNPPPDGGATAPPGGSGTAPPGGSGTAPPGGSGTAPPVGAGDGPPPPPVAALGNIEEGSQNAPPPTPPPPPSGLAPRRNDVAQRKSLIQEYLSGLDQETRTEYGHQYEPLISDVQYAGREVYNSTFRRISDTTYGNCYTFNTGSNGTDELLSAYNTGPDYGLKVLFAIEEEEYIGEITYKQGLRVVIHPAASPPFPAELGFDVHPGVATAVGIRKVAIDRLGGRYNDCINTSLSNARLNVYEEILDWTKYTIIGCQKTCYQLRVKRSCGCFDQDFPSEGKAFSEVTSRTGVCRFSNETEFNCRAYIYEKFKNGDLACSQCWKPCHEDFYERTVSTSLWPATKYLPTLKNEYQNKPYIRRVLNDPEETYPRNLGLLEIYFESLNLEENTEQPAYDNSQFIADIGGAIGLWVGASIMTIFEFGEFFFDSFIICCAKLCRGSKRRPPKPQRRDNVQNSHQTGRDEPPKRHDNGNNKYRDGRDGRDGRDSPYNQGSSYGSSLPPVLDPETLWNYSPSLERAAVARSRHRADDWVRPSERDQGYHNGLDQKLGTRHQMPHLS